MGGVCSFFPPAGLEGCGTLSRYAPVLVHMPQYMPLSSLETPSKNHAIPSVTRPGDDYLGAGFGPKLSSAAAGIRREYSMENTCPMTRLPELTTKSMQSRHSHELSTVG